MRFLTFNVFIGDADKPMRALTLLVDYTRIWFFCNSDTLN